MSLFRWENDSSLHAFAAHLIRSLCVQAAPLTGESFFFDRLNRCEILPGVDCCHVNMCIWSGGMRFIALSQMSVVKV